MLFYLLFFYIFYYSFYLVGELLTKDNYLDMIIVSFLFILDLLISVILELLFICEF